MITEYLQQRKAAFEALDKLKHPIEAVGNLVVETLRSGGSILTCGNGGSAAEAQHFSSELLGRFKGNRRSLPSFCMSADAGTLTCIVNDFGPDALFARQLEGLGREGDLLVVLTTSGKSRNILKVLETANSMNLTTLALLGKDGGDCRGLASHELIMPSDSTGIIQELHLCLIHYFCELVEEAFPSEGN